jgi:hypothetical protein
LIEGIITLQRARELIEGIIMLRRINDYAYINVVVRMAALDTNLGFPAVTNVRIRSSEHAESSLGH